MNAKAMGIVAKSLAKRKDPKRDSGRSAVTAPAAKVLLLTDAFLPRAGGSREYYYNIYRRLAASADIEVTVLTKKVPGWEEFDRQATSPGFRMRRRFRPLSSWKYGELPKGIGPFLHALWLAWKYSPDVVHAGDLYPQGLTALVLKKILGLPYIIYCHGEEITQTDCYRYQPLVRNHIYCNADAVVANSEFAKQQLLRIGVAHERLHKITPGVEAARFQNALPNSEFVNKHGLGRKTVILTVARLVPRKGHRAALQAFSRVCGEFPDAHYLIVGTGPEELRIRQQVQDLGLQERVTLAGFMPADQLPALYNLADVMLLANRREADGDIEGFGIVFLEANAAGKPVIGGRSGGAIEAIEDGSTGYLVDPDSPDEIAAALRRLLADPGLRNSLGAAGRKRSIEQYDWDSRAKALETVNRALLRGRSAGQPAPESFPAPSRQSISSAPCGVRESEVGKTIKA